jgi:hypothetical protein
MIRGKKLVAINHRLSKAGGVNSSCSTVGTHHVRWRVSEHDLPWVTDNGNMVKDKSKFTI